MPLKEKQQTTAPQDRKLLIGIAALLLLITGIVFVTAATDPGYGASPSSYGTGSSGAKAAFMLLQDTGYNPRRWTQSPDALKQFPPGTTLILAEPLASEQRDIEAVKQFILRGGRVLGTGIGIASFLPATYTAARPPHFAWKTYYPALPAQATRGVHEIAMAPKFYFHDSDPAKSDSVSDSEELFRNGVEVPVIRVPYGKGEVIWWSASDPLTNAGIREKDDAQLLLNFIGAPGSAPVLWDEYFHQGGKTVLDSIWQSPLKWGILQLLLLGMAVCCTWSRRFGPVRPAASPSRLAPMEFVETLASLYQRAQAANVALEIVYQRFRTALHSRFSIRKDVPPSGVRQLLSGRVTAVEADEIEDAIADAEEAIASIRTSPARACVLVRRLQTAAQQLGLKT